jgi:hypothetical protein
MNIYHCHLPVAKYHRYTYAMKNKQTTHPDINFYAQIMQYSLFIIDNSFAKNVKKVHEKKIDKNLNNKTYA